MSPDDNDLAQVAGRLLFLAVAATQNPICEQLEDQQQLRSPMQKKNGD